jgi:hypothetical protein
MGFWEDTLSSSIGSFIGILGAYGVAKWQMGKTHKLNNVQFYLQFNDAQIYINRFERKIAEIIKKTQGTERKHARILLHKRDFIELREYIELTIKTLNYDIKEVNFDNFTEELGKINRFAPIAYYKDLNFLIFSMAIIYNLLLFDCRNLINDLPKRIEFPMLNNLSIQFMVKKFRSKYKKMKSKLKV